MILKVLKRIIKEIARFSLVVILSGLFVYGGYLLPYAIQGHGMLILWAKLWFPLVVLATVFALLKVWKRNLSWGWLIDTLVVLAICFLCMHIEFKSMGVPLFMDSVKHQKFIALLDENHNAPVVIPDEKVFDRMKKYEEGQYKVLEKENLYVDNDNQPITGAIIGKKTSGGSIIAIKGGKLHGYGIWHTNSNGKRIIMATTKNENGKLKAMQMFYSQGQIFSEGIIKDDYFQYRRFYKTGELMYQTIGDNKGLGIIIQTFDKLGHRNIEIDMISMSSTCQLPDGSKRMLTPVEITNLFKETDKVLEDFGNLDYELDYEPDVLCH